MPYMNRRKLLGASMAAGSMLLSSMKAHAKFAGDVQLRGQIERLERLPTLSLDSREKFRTSLRKFVNRDMAIAANKRAAQVLKAAGADPREEMSYQQVVELLEGDPILMNHLHAFLNNQIMGFKDVRDVFHSDADRYLEEMEKADRSGPGSLQLNPGMHIPDYARWEIHNQPGGYVGDPFAGHIFHYGVNNFWMHLNDQEEKSAEVSASVPIPADGKVRRIVDIGTSVGQIAITLKERFKDAEVWGIDVGAPMVRYAHMRSIDLGIDVNYAQMLAEDMQFPDNHMDIVAGFLLFHEVDMDATPKIIDEIFRVLRPGGTFFCPEAAFSKSVRSRNAASQWRIWWNDQWCSEVHYIPYADFDYPAAFSRAGFQVSTIPGPYNREYMMATKPA